MFPVPRNLTERGAEMLRTYATRLDKLLVEISDGLPDAKQVDTNVALAMAEVAKLAAELRHASTTESQQPAGPAHREATRRSRLVESADADDAPHFPAEVQSTIDKLGEAARDFRETAISAMETIFATGEASLASDLADHADRIFGVLDDWINNPATGVENGPAAAEYAKRIGDSLRDAFNSPLEAGRVEEVTTVLDELVSLIGSLAKGEMAAGEFACDGEDPEGVCVVPTGSEPLRSAAVDESRTRFMDQYTEYFPGHAPTRPSDDYWSADRWR